MNQEAFGLIFTGEHNPYMRDLVLSRAVAAVPFGGRYRVIDKAIVGENAVIGDNVQIGVPPREGETIDNRLTGDIALIGNDVVVPAGAVIPRGAVVTSKTIGQFTNGGAQA